MWLVGVVVRRYIDILIIIINFPYNYTPLVYRERERERERERGGREGGREGGIIMSFFDSSILTSLFIF